jgi:hypothetical protein
MTVRSTDDGTIVLKGRCPIEDAETLMRLLSLNRSATVDWRECDYLHTAIIQILLAARPAMLGPPRFIQLRQWIAPILAGVDPFVVAPTG